jgi:hypothetical protein
VHYDGPVIMNNFLPEINFCPNKVKYGFSFTADWGTPQTPDRRMEKSTRTAALLLAMRKNKQDIASSSKRSQLRLTYSTHNPLASARARGGGGGRIFFGASCSRLVTAYPIPIRIESTSSSHCSSQCTCQSGR